MFEVLEAPVDAISPEHWRLFDGADDQEADLALAMIRDERSVADLAEARLVQWVARFADARACDDDEWMAAGGDGREQAIQLAGEGTPHVAEFAIADLAVALSMTQLSARKLIGDVLELRHRLPQTWARVADGSLQVWRARQVAAATPTLSIEAALWIDAQVSSVAHALSFGRLNDLVEASRMRFDPDGAEEQARLHRSGEHVTMLPTLGRAHVDLHATLAAPDANALDATLNRGAAILLGLGDDRESDERRASVLGMLADPQLALDLMSGAVDPRRPVRKAATTLYIHVHADALAGDPGIARVEGLGPQTLETVRDWLGGRTVRVQPVIDLNDRYSVDAYEAPPRLREQTLLKDTACVFPWCGRRGRVMDHDHIEPFVPPDDGGHPGQTESHNQARLCRYHHRVKTRTSWRYSPRPEGGYSWLSPGGDAYVVDHRGTHASPRDSCSDLL